MSVPRAKVSLPPKKNQHNVTISCILVFSGLSHVEPSQHLLDGDAHGDIVALPSWRQKRKR